MTLLMILMFVILPVLLERGGDWVMLHDRRQFQYSLLAIGVLTSGRWPWLKTEQITDDMLETRVMLVWIGSSKIRNSVNSPFFPATGSLRV